MNDMQPPPSGNDPRRLYAARMNRIIRFIEEHLDADLSLQELSGMASFSPFHFHRQFREYTGISVARLVRLLRLRRASLQLALNPAMSITDIALEAGYANSESFSRAFREIHGRTPSDFRRDPDWKSWQVKRMTNDQEQDMNTDVELVDFPSTRVAAVEHQGPEEQSYSGTMRLIAWRRENGVGPHQGNTYGVHYTDPSTTPPAEHRLDICVSHDQDVARNPHGVVGKVIPGGRCARIRHHGSRDHIPEAEFLYREWLPGSGQELRDYPLFFHYVNVGPEVTPAEMITDVYLPLK